MKQIVISLYDYTGEALKPWAEAGYTCYAFDIQHPKDRVVKDHFDSGGIIRYAHADLHDFSTHQDLFFSFSGRKVAFGMAFPVCTDLAVSGAAWFKKKAEADPLFQQRAAQHATDCAGLFDDFGCPYFIENPVSVLSTLWRKPDYSFHPYEYGGYIAKNDAQHPRWPDYIADRDAYPKKTCLWTGNGFVMPPKVPVEPETGHSRQHLKLGGKSAKTKNIRSATPRGFAIAVMAANTQKDTSNGNQDRSRQAVQDTDLLVS
jgi:hypothetical protein